MPAISMTKLSYTTSTYIQLISENKGVNESGNGGWESTKIWGRFYPNTSTQEKVLCDCTIKLAMIREKSEMIY